MRFRRKSKAERHDQWERIAWKIAARKGWTLQAAAQYLSEWAIEFWLSRTMGGFVKGIVREGSRDPYLERASEYQKMAGVSEDGATNLW